MILRQISGLFADLYTHVHHRVLKELILYWLTENRKKKWTHSSLSNFWNSKIRKRWMHSFFFWFSVIVKRAKVVCKVLQKFWHSSFIVFANMPLETFLKNSCCNGHFLIYVFFNDHEWRWSPRMVGMVIWRGIALYLYILNTNRMYFKLTAPNMKSIFFLNVKYRINWLLLLNIQW